MIENTFVIPVIRPDLIERCLETLYKNTVPNFYVYLIDQTVDGLDSTKLRNQYRNLMVIRTPRSNRHTTGNLGFAKATNLGIKLVDTPYFTMCNDDVEFIDRRWWGGVMDAFKKTTTATPDRPCMMVNPGSVKLPDWSVGRERGDDFYILPYKERYTKQDYSSLIEEQHYVNEHLTLMPGSVIDGVVFYCSVFETEKFREVGFLDEKFYPGGGEDYDYNTRANMHGYRCVGTTMSWVFHHWSKTLSAEDSQKIREQLQQPELRWNNNDEKWGKGFDIWGMKCQECGETLQLDKDEFVCYQHQPITSLPAPKTTIQPL